MSSTQGTITAPEIIQENTLPGLPKELLEAIAEECDPSDLLALRQASRLIHNAIDRTFLREYFTDRDHLLTVDSLKDLIHVTATPRMCKTLSRLTLSMPWLEQRYWGPGPKAVCSSPCMREDHSSNDGERDNCAVWAAWLQARSQLTDSMRPLLEQALLNVASTEGTNRLYLKLDEGRSSFGRLHGKTSFERYLNGPMHVPNKVVDVPLLEYYSRESTLNLLLAIADSCIPLRELHLPMDKFFSYEKRREEQVPEWDPEWFPHLQHKILRPFSHVHTIGLGDHAHRWSPPMSGPHLQDIVANWFPALTSLSVPSYVDMRRLIATFPPGKFKHICIERCYYPILWDQVRALLFHHRSSVVHVSLTKFVYKCRYERATDRLQDLLQWIADNLELQMLEFEGSKYHKAVYEDMKCAWQGDIKAELSKFFESRYLFTKPIAYVAAGDESDDDDDDDE